MTTKPVVAATLGLAGWLALGAALAAPTLPPTDRALAVDRPLPEGAGRATTWLCCGAEGVRVTLTTRAGATTALTLKPFSASLPGVGADEAETVEFAPGTRLADVPIDAAYIGSCTNARLSDLRVAAEVLRGRRVAPGVTAICVPGSSAVRRQAEAEGLDRVFTEAGFAWHESGCGLCGNGGRGQFADLRVISTTNRNFEGRQGPRTRTHLASPATVAASAIAGRIADPRLVLGDA